jgi:hypothetical protein
MEILVVAVGGDEIPCLTVHKRKVVAPNFAQRKAVKRSMSEAGVEPVLIDHLLNC